MSTPITITNPTFEDIALADGARSTAAPTGWTLTGSGGVIDPSGGVVANVTGQNAAFLNNGATLSQTLGTTYDAEQIYSFTADLGDALGDGAQDYTLNLYAGATLIGTISGNTADSDSLQTVTLVSTVADSNLNGQTLRLEIAQTGGSGELLIDAVQGEFDAAIDGTGANDAMGLGFIDGQGDQITTGDDAIRAGAGNDTVDGGAGNDIVDGGVGDDSFVASTGNDVFVGGAGTDTYDSSGNAVGAVSPSTNPDTQVSTTVDLSGSGTVEQIFEGSTDTVQGVERFIAGEDVRVVTGTVTSGNLNIQNASFEAQNLPNEEGARQITAWDQQGRSEVYNPGNGEPIQPIDGDNVVDLQRNNATISQTLSDVYDANNVYTFNIAAGIDDGPSEFAARIFAGNTLIGEIVEPLGPATGLNAFTVSSTVFDPSLNGEPIRIEIQRTGGDPVYIDGVSGTFEDVLEIEDDITISEAVRPTEVVDIAETATGTFTSATTGATIAFGGTGEPTISQILDGSQGPSAGTFTITGGDEAGSIGGIEFENYETINFSTICFTPGVRIATPDGEVPVEDLQVGDVVITRDNGHQPIRWIGRRHLEPEILSRADRLRPVRISAGALGAGVPSSDLVVSPQHRILLRSRIAQRMFGEAEILVAARHLTELDGVEIAEDYAAVTYIHIMLDRHEVVTANGAPAETLYLGRETLKTLTPEGRQEIATLFPRLDDPDFAPPKARFTPQKGKHVRKLLQRHGRNAKPVYSDAV